MDTILRMRTGSRSDGWALTLLLLAMATVFVFGLGRLHDGNLDGISRNHLTVAANLSPEHGFLGFYHWFLDEDGEIAYRVYNRYPLGGHLLVKAAIAPFPGDPPAQIRAARTLMLAFFAAAAVAAFVSLRRLTSSPGVALAATLLAFSSFYPLRYADMVAIEGSIDLFVVLLTFHGMVVFAQEGRFRQLLVKTCGALLVGWHVYGLLLPFIVFGLASDWYRRGGGQTVGCAAGPQPPSRARRRRAVVRTVGAGVQLRPRACLADRTTPGAARAGRRSGAGGPAVVPVDGAAPGMGCRLQRKKPCRRVPTAAGLARPVRRSGVDSLLRE